MREHVPAVGDLERELHVLLDQQDRATGALRVLPHDREQGLDDHRRKPEAELVEQEQPRLAGERAADGEHLLLAAREQPGAPRPQLAQQGEVLVRDLLVDVPAAPGETEVLGDGQPEEDAATLGHVRDPAPRPPGRGDTPEIFAVEDDPALHRADDPGDHSQRRRLAGPVRAQQRDHLARPDRQVEVADDGRLVVAGRQALERQDVAHAEAISASISAAALPRYASTTRGSRRTASGVPWAITLPNSSTTT